MTPSRRPASSRSPASTRAPRCCRGPTTASTIGFPRDAMLGELAAEPRTGRRRSRTSCAEPPRPPDRRRRRAARRRRDRGRAVGGLDRRGRGRAQGASEKRRRQAEARAHPLTQVVLDTFGGRDQGDQDRCLTSRCPISATLMKTAQKLQGDIARVQEELAQAECEASAGGGMVTVAVNGHFEVVRSRSTRPRSTRPTSACSRT